MNGKKTIEHHETVTGSIPSQTALESERRVTALEEGHKDLVKGQQDMVIWMRKLEGSVEILASNINEKLERITHRPAGTYIGIISLLFGAVGIAATLIVFVQDARLAPIRSQLEQIQKDDDEAFHQWVEDYAMIQRSDQVLIDRGLKGSVDPKEKKNYSQPKYKRPHGRPTP